MPSWVTQAIELAKLWQNELITAVVTIAIVSALVVRKVRKWRRGHHLDTLLLMREVGIHMIQNRPPTDNAHRLQQNLIWWDGKVVEILPRAGAMAGEIAQFQALGNIYLPTVIAQKIARLDAIINRLEGR